MFALCLRGQRSGMVALVPVPAAARDPHATEERATVLTRGLGRLHIVTGQPWQLRTWVEGPGATTVTIQGARGP